MSLPTPWQVLAYEQAQRVSLGAITLAEIPPAGETCKTCQFHTPATLHRCLNALSPWPDCLVEPEWWCWFWEQPQEGIAETARLGQG